MCFLLLEIYLEICQINTLGEIMMAKILCVLYDDPVDG